MASIDIKIHPQSGVVWKPLAEVAPLLNIEFGEEEPPNALLFADPDGETHVYVIGEEGRANLLRMLTGGIIVPTNGAAIQ
jgi:hypothetical protein